VDESRLRPLERRVLHLHRGGESPADIAARFRRTPSFISRILEMAEMPRAASATGPGDGLRPIERRVLRWRENGADYTEIARRFRRSPGAIKRIEGFARLKQG
jgi:DNA-binding CsgD family transcriptional regulator